MAWYEFMVAPPHKRNEPSMPLINFGCNARNLVEARQQAEAIYGKNCERGPIVPAKK